MEITDTTEAEGNIPNPNDLQVPLPPRIGTTDEFSRKRRQANETTMYELMKAIYEFYRVLPLEAQEQYLNEFLATKQNLERKVHTERLMEGEGMPNFLNINDVECYVCSSTVPKTQITLHLLSCLRNHFGESLDFTPRKRLKTEHLDGGPPELLSISFNTPSPNKTRNHCIVDNCKGEKAKSNRHVVITFGDNDVNRLCRWTHFSETLPLWSKFNEKPLINFPTEINCFCCKTPTTKGIIISHTAHRKNSTIKLECCSWHCFYNKIATHVKQTTWEASTKSGQTDQLRINDTQEMEADTQNDAETHEGLNINTSGPQSPISETKH